MLNPDPPARLPQIRDEDFTDETRAFFGQWTGGIFKDADKNPVLRTFGHHPALANAFSPLNIHLLSANTLPVKLRQIANEPAVRVLVGDHAVLVSGDEKHVVGVVFIKGHPVVKSVVRMVRQLLRSPNALPDGF